jgi:two-component system sensor histidine kinase ChiS
MPSPKPKTILIVEDEPDTAEMFSQMLRLSGYRVIKTYGGISGMKQLLHEKPDLLLLDIMMNDISGLEVLRFLRREPQFEDLPVIVISAKGTTADINAGMEAGATVYMTKPVAYLELKGTVEETFARYGR